MITVNVEFSMNASWGTLLIVPQDDEGLALLKKLGGGGFRLHEEAGISIKVWLRNLSEGDITNWKILEKLREQNKRLTEKLTSFKERLRRRKHGVTTPQRRSGKARFSAR